jgi:hypothetical protein
VTPTESPALALARTIFGALLEDNQNFAVSLMETALAGAGAVARSLDPDACDRLEAELVEIAAVLGAVAGLAAEITRRATAAGVKLNNGNAEIPHS